MQQYIFFGAQIDNDGEIEVILDDTYGYSPSGYPVLVSFPLHVATMLCGSAIMPLVAEELAIAVAL